VIIYALSRAVKALSSQVSSWKTIM
jgi:hypothetical protein